MNKRTLVLALALVTATTVSQAIVGCKNPSFTSAITSQQEKTVGDWAAAQIQSESVGPMDPEIAVTVNAIASRLNAATPGFAPPRILISDSDTYSVASLPGGWVVISARMVTLMQSDPDALAGLLAHEYAHEEADDALKQMSGALGSNTLVNLTTEGKYSEASDIAVQLMNFGHDMDDEYQADIMGVRIAGSAGYDPHGILSAVAILRAVTPTYDAQWLSVHPVTAKRLHLLSNDIADYSAQQKTK